MKSWIILRVSRSTEGYEEHIKLNLSGLCDITVRKKITCWFGMLGESRIHESSLFRWHEVITQWKLKSSKACLLRIAFVFLFRKKMQLSTADSSCCGPTSTSHWGKFISYYGHFLISGNDFELLELKKNKQNTTWKIKKLIFVEYTM